LLWQQNLGHNGLELGLRKRYIEDLCIRWGVFKIGLFSYGQCAIIQKRTYALPQKSYVKYTKNRYYLATKTFLHFLTIPLRIKYTITHMIQLLDRAFTVRMMRKYTAKYMSVVSAIAQFRFLSIQYLHYLRPTFTRRRAQLLNGVFTRSSKRPAIHVYFEYICWKFAGRLLDRVNTLKPTAVAAVTVGGATLEKPPKVSVAMVT